MILWELGFGQAVDPTSCTPDRPQSQDSVIVVKRIIDSFSNSFTNPRYALQIQKTSGFNGAHGAKMAEKRLFTPSADAGNTVQRRAAD